MTIYTKKYLDFVLRNISIVLLLNGSWTIYSYGKSTMGRFSHISLYIYPYRYPIIYRVYTGIYGTYILMGFNKQWNLMIIGAPFMVNIIGEPSLINNHDQPSIINHCFNSHRIWEFAVEHGHFVRWFTQHITWWIFPVRSHGIPEGTPLIYPYNII